MKKILIQLVTIILFQGILLAQGDLVINGKALKNPGYSKIYLENIITQTTIDSAAIDKSGAFVLKTKIAKGDFYKLKFSNEHYLLLVLNPEEIVNVEVDLTNLYSPVIKGSKNSELVYNTFDKMREFDEELESYKKQIELKKIEYLKNFILNNTNSLSSLFFIDNIPIDENIDVYVKLDEGLSKLYADNYMVKNLHEKVKSLTTLRIGSLAPEIDLPGIDGKNIKLSSLQGKVVLIDFWAGWCGPCRRESPNMVALYKKYKEKGFTIYSVSLDQNRPSWTSAIEKDGLGDWTHVSDLKYWGSKAAKDYNVESIPFTVLLDKEGKIIAKGLRGEQLNAKLAEIFP